MSFSDLTRRENYYKVPTESERLKQRARHDRIRNAVTLGVIAVIAFTGSIGIWLYTIPAQPVTLRYSSPTAAPSTSPNFTQQIYPPDKVTKGKS